LIYRKSPVSKKSGKRGSAKVTGQLESISVTWDSCQEEFHATKDSPIAWIEDGAFALFPHSISR
jgi:hypothetical protein